MTSECKQCVIVEFDLGVGKGMLLGHLMKFEYRPD